MTFSAVLYVTFNGANDMLRLERIPQAASRMGVSASQVYREIRRGRLGPLVKVGPKYSALPAESVDGWISDRIREATKSGGEK